MPSNNSFKPNLLRYTKAMAKEACHGFGSTTQVGLTQALGLMQTSFAILLGTAICLGACTSADRAATSDNPLLAELITLTGADALECGLVPLGADSAKAWSCAESASRNGTPHWFAMQLQGIDSDIWQASLLTPSSQQFILDYDSNYMGGSGLMPRFSRDTCNGRVVLVTLRTKPGVELQCSRK